uniref:Crystallin J1C-like n=1 Tax=Sinocyclocheilus rhinocerous TaxID=307959 RepID=A0A673FT56_9TELE
MSLALADRAIGAIIGSAVADAAAQPLHWVYDLQKLSVLLSQSPEPEFRPESANPFYRRNTGQQSCYGDQAFVLLESLSECEGLNVEDLKQRTYKFFGPGSEYDTPVNDPYSDKGGKLIYCTSAFSYLFTFLLVLLEIFDVFAIYFGFQHRMVENHKLECCSISFFFRFLEHFILNGPDPKALDAVLKQLNDPNRKNPQELDKAIIGHIHQVKDNLSKKPKELIPTLVTGISAALSCLSGLPGAFQAALHGVLTASGYEQAIRDTMSCGGCTCSRSSFIGACIGAQVGLEGIPSSWKSKTLRYNTLLVLAKKVVTLQQL